MIKYKDQILLNDSPVFTKISIENPLKESLNLPSDACYLYIEDGDGHTLVPQKNIIASPGTVILSTCGLTAGRMISTHPKGSIDTIIVHFNQHLLDLVFDGDKPELWQELSTPVTEYLVQEAADQLIINYFDGITNLFKSKEAVTDNILKLKLKEIILLLLQSRNSESVLQIVRSLFSERVFSFKELIDAYLFTPASIEQLAMITNCSLSTFKRRFFEVYKSSPGKFILLKRLEKVEELLRISDDSIAQIGYECGFESPEHLSRAFKDKFGQSPSMYRMSFSVN